MHSLFPGMDPFLELQEWEDFHYAFNGAIRDVLSPRLAPRYLVCAERRVYVESPGADEPATSLKPFDSEVPMPEERRETYLLIRLQQTMEIVTVLETLSPSNKRPGGDGRREYLTKREEVLNSPSHLVELDLLRGGLRLPMVTPLPPADYYAIVTRRQRRPKAAAYAWSIRDQLPTIAPPLKPGDPDVSLDLQAVFTLVYDVARYDLSVNYASDLQPPLGEADAAWARALLQSRKN